MSNEKVAFINRKIAETELFLLNRLKLYIIAAIAINFVVNVLIKAI